MAKTFLNLNSTNDVCFLCKNAFKATDNALPFKDQQEWDVFKNQWLLWSRVHIPSEDKKHLFKTLDKKIKDKICQLVLHMIIAELLLERNLNSTKIGTVNL